MVINFHIKHQYNSDTIESRINFYSYSSHQYMYRVFMPGVRSETLFPIKFKSKMWQVTFLLNHHTTIRLQQVSILTPLL